MSWRSCSKVTRSLAVVTLALIVTPTFAEGSEEGEKVYLQTCIACHGANGKGSIPGVGDFTQANGPLAQSDEALIKSIRDGLTTPGKPLSMPAKGGNPSLTDAQIAAVLRYLRASFSDDS